MSRFSSPNKSNDFANARLDETEKFLKDIHRQYSKFAAKEANLRDRNDQFVECIHLYAANEKLNSTLSNSLKAYADYLSAVEQYRDTMIQRIEKQVLRQFEKYQEIFKYMRKSTNRSRSKVRKEIDDQRRHEQLMGRSISDNGRSSSQSSLLHQNDDLYIKQFEEFEENKLKDIKSCFVDFTLIQLSYHARALEMYTNAHQQLLGIDVQKDIEDYKRMNPLQKKTRESSSFQFDHSIVPSNRSKKKRSNIDSNTRRSPQPSEVEYAQVIRTKTKQPIESTLQYYENQNKNDIENDEMDDQTTSSDDY